MSSQYITDAAFFAEVQRELATARQRFPRQDVWVTLAALTEEVGELNQAVLQYNFEPEKGKTEPQINKEAVQVAVAAMRVALDTMKLSH